MTDISPERAAAALQRMKSNVDRDDLEDEALEDYDTVYAALERIATPPQHGDEPATQEAIQHTRQLQEAVGHEMEKLSRREKYLVILSDGIEFLLTENARLRDFIASAEDGKDG